MSNKQHLRRYATVVAALVTAVSLGAESLPNRSSTNAILNISGTYPHLGGLQRRRRNRHGRGGAVGGQALVRHLSAAPSQRRPDKLWTLDTNLTLDGAARKRRRHARQPLDSSRIAAADHRPLLHRHQRQRPRRFAGNDARTPHRQRAPSHRPDQQGLFRLDGGRVLRRGREYAGGHHA